MNGEYHTSSTPNAPGSFPTDFKNYPGGVEYFDVYHGPITSTYSQVWWTSTANDIPKEVVDRFDGKAIAIVGVEMDQVRKGESGEDISLPITAAYNHHHDTAVIGKNSHMVKMDMHDPRVPPRGQYVRLSHHQAWVPMEHTPTQSGLPTRAMFSDGNGGEYRKTFHAYAPPFAQIVESPTTLAGSPMQIDTWNRDHMNLSETNPKFVPGPYPRAHTLAPSSGPDAIYSGLLECPLTTRITKTFDGGNGGFNDTVAATTFACGEPKEPHTCKNAIDSAQACFEAAMNLPGIDALAVTNTTVNDVAAPSGCSIAASASASASASPTAAAAAVVVTFNSATKGTACASTFTTSIGSSKSLVNLALNVSSATKLAIISITGPADVWFGVGFNAQAMADKPYAIIVDGITGAVSERRLGDHDHGAPQGALLNSSVKVISNTVSKDNGGGLRTVVLSRPLQGATAKHYTFDPAATHIQYINALGSGAKLAYHKAKSAATIALFPSHAKPLAVCKAPALPFGSGSGRINYLGSDSVGFNAGRCPAQPRGDLLAQRNPTCDLRTYSGGLSTCHHGWHLLDADQDIPWADQPLVYYKKFRVYYQPYNASFHKQIQRHDWGIGADSDHAEWDVPKCPEGTPTPQCNHTITGTWMPVPPGGQDQYMVLAHFHCHAPTCLKVELWNNDTGKLLCRQEPIYGGTGIIDQKRFDEPGYVAIPTCMWGSPEHGLERPPKMNGVTIFVKGVTNNTYGHQYVFFFLRFAVFFFFFFFFNFLIFIYFYCFVFFCVTCAHLLTPHPFYHRASFNSHC